MYIGQDAPKPEDIDAYLRSAGYDPDAVAARMRAAAAQALTDVGERLAHRRSPGQSLWSRLLCHLDENPGAMWMYIWFGGAALMVLITWAFDLTWP
jgi:hypothetical protein